MENDQGHDAEGERESRIAHRIRGEYSISDLFHHTCTCTSATIHTLVRLHKRETPRAVDLDLSALQLSDESFLCDVIRKLPSPGNYGMAIKFKGVLPALAASPAAAAVLRMRTESLKHADVKRLYEAIEDAIELMPVERKHTHSTQARGMFARTSAHLADGTGLTKVGFHTRFTSDANRQKPHETPLLKPNPIVTKQPLIFDSFEERNSVFLETARATKAYVLSLCGETFANHDRAVEILNAASATPINEELLDSPPHFWNKQILRLTEKGQLAILVRKLKPGISPRGISFQGLRTLAGFQPKATARYIYEVTQSRVLLPQIVLVACLIAIITETAWNLETCLHLTVNNIRRRGNQYDLVGVKARSNTVQDGEVPIIDGQVLPEVTLTDAMPCKAIELLLWHGNALKHFLGQASPTVFLTFVRKEAGAWEFVRIKPDLRLTEFWEYHKVEYINFRQLRQLAAHLDYLSPGGNIFSTQLLLQHASIDTTQEYLHTRLFIRLWEENSRRFMTKMAATAFFVTGRGGILKDKGLEQSDIQLALFPTTEYPTESSISDEWFNRDDLRFPVGMEELRYCAIQYAYYRASANSLIAENPTRFVRVHLPRLVFCVTLREIILASLHAALYKKIEREWS